MWAAQPPRQTPIRQNLWIGTSELQPEDFLSGPIWKATIFLQFRWFLCSLGVFSKDSSGRRTAPKDNFEAVLFDDDSEEDNGICATATYG